MATAPRKKTNPYGKLVIQLPKLFRWTRNRQRARVNLRLGGRR